MTLFADSIYLNGVWLSVGGNTPWGLGDKINAIQVYQSDPRNVEGAESAFIKIEFDDGSNLEVKTNDYMIYFRGDK